jgi:hypothetical protein
VLFLAQQKGHETLPFRAIIHSGSSASWAQLVLAATLLIGLQHGARAARPPLGPGSESRRHRAGGAGGRRSEGREDWNVLSKSRAWLAFGLAFACLSASAAAADGCPTSADPIATDRPDVTNSSLVVPLGSLQSENGINLSGGDDATLLDAANTRLRLGVAHCLEVLVDVPTYFAVLGGEASSGWTNVTPAIKWQVSPVPGKIAPALARHHARASKLALIGSIAAEPGLGLLVVLAAGVLSSLEPGMQAHA